MKRYIKDGIIKTRNQIVIKSQRTIKDKDGNEKEVKTQIINPREDMLLADGWVEYVESLPTEEELQVRREINSAKRVLDATDYKVIKCMEAFLFGEALPYDIAELHQARNEQRAIINELE